MRMFLAVLAVTFVAIWYGVRSQDSEGADTGCALTGAGLVALSVALTKGDTSEEVIRLVGPRMDDAECREAVRHLVDDGAATVDVQGPDGTTEQFITYPELTHPATAALVDETAHCDGWRIIDIAFQLCLNGDLGPR
ncbi:hypothetical protein NLS1_29920 [Nocardioides sp. LS1]|nr:hypothetical protein NLS1_29920 [Nocardioides sp. LS1]